MRRDDERATIPVNGRYNAANGSEADMSVARPALTREQGNL